MNRNRRLALALAVFALLLTAAADAAIRLVRPGEVPNLRPDEGLLLVEIDSSTPVGSIHIARQDNEPGGETVTDIPKGKSTLLYVVPARAYRWGQIHPDPGHNYYYDAPSDASFAFDVAPGVITYAGDLVWRPGTRLQLRVANRSMVAIDWLRMHAPDVYARFRFAYAGLYPDPFPEFYAAERARQPGSDADLDKTLPAPAPGPLPIAFEELTRPSHVRDLALNPRGDLVAELTSDKADAWHVDVIDLKAGLASRVFDLDYPITDLRWTSDQVLSVSAGTKVPVVRIIRIGEGGPQGRTHTGFSIPAPGRLVSALPGRPDHVVFERWRAPVLSKSTIAETSMRDDTVALYDLDITSQDSVAHALSDKGARIDRGLHGAYQWLVDARGEPRAAVVSTRGGDALYWGADGSFKEVLQRHNPFGFRPIALSEDGNRVYGLIEKDRPQRDLVEFDPATGTISRTVFSKPGRDVEGVAFDLRGKLVGARYYENGEIAVNYFDQDSRAIMEALDKAFPDKSVVILARDDANAHFLVHVDGSDRPPQYYYFDLEHRTAELIDEAAPWLSKTRLAPSQVVRAQGSDGLPIEGYLTLPPNASGKLPLVVMAHGGPIGIRDRRIFDPTVQLFASLGYAVLQVNFRGSEGFGRAFRKAGEKHFGSLIEDDIDAVTRAALAQHPLDEKRMCAVGASYGGFSALVSAIRWPGRFRCAVSIAGVSDQMLLFTASDSSSTRSRREVLESIIGNPHTDAERMRNYSPLYRYRELTLPIMLAHGTEDVRVDYEHTRRLVRMLNLAGHPPVVLTIENGGHGGWSGKDDAKLWTSVAGFLRANLDKP